MVYIVDSSTGKTMYLSDWIALIGPRALQESAANTHSQHLRCAMFGRQRQEPRGTAETYEASASRVENNLPFVGPIGGVRVTSSSLFRADRMGCPWALRTGVVDMVSARVPRLWEQNSSQMVSCHSLSRCVSPADLGRK